MVQDQKPAQGAARGAAPPDGADGQEAGWFGYRPVDPTQKASLVRGVFDSVAGRYDLMNDLMSGGIHRLWKARLIAAIRPRPSMRLVDVAGGTGDIAMRFVEAGGGDVVVCDINEQMVRVGRDRAIDHGMIDRIGWVTGDAEHLPLPDRSVDAYTIAFGLRNVTRIDAALAEARRVLRPGGRFFCLEFSHVVVPTLAWLYERYSFDVLPRLGSLVAGDRDAYQYLVESIRKFPDQGSLVARMEAAGLERGRYVNLTGGIAALHSAWRI